MNVAVKKTWTIEEFLGWEERQELKYEFDGIQPVAMTGGTFAHNVIQVNLIAEMRNRLLGKPCRVNGDSLKIHVMGSIRYPDAFVTCTPIQRDSLVVYEPVVIFEVLSKSTEHTDRSVKNREYAGTASVRRYIILEQVAMKGTMYTRSADGADWRSEPLDANAVLNMPEIGVDLPLAVLYTDVDLSSPPTEA
jgi:Uma2 family endonuclease